MTTILTKKKDTTGAPAPGDLTNAAGGAELAVNTFDKRLYTKDAGGNVVEIGTNPSTIDTTTVDTTNLEVTNIKAKDGTASATIANSTGIFTHSTATVFTAGTVSAPAITTTGDTNTGMYFPAADTIAFTEGGVEAMRINSSANVGIGTDSPNGKLEVRTAGTGSATIARFGRSDALVSADIFYDGSDGTISFGTTTNHPIAFDTNNVERMRITSDGFVIVGGTTSLSGTRFQVTAGAISANPVANQYALLGADVAGSTSPTTYYGIGYDGTNGIATFEALSGGVAWRNIGLATRGGNVGIGTSSPAFRLQLGSNASASTATPETISLGGTFSPTSGANGKLRVWFDGTNYMGFGVSGGQLDYITTAAYDHVFYTNGTEKVRINSNGGVGIGTASISYQLDVYGSINSNFGQRIQNGSSGGSAYTSLFFDNDSAGTKSAIVKNSSTNTTNTGLANSFYMYYNDTGGSGIQNVTSTPIIFWTAHAERMRITSAGNVGIGTSNPLSLLHVRSNPNGGTDASNCVAQVTLGDSGTYSDGILFVKNAGNRGNRGNADGSPLLNLQFNDITGLIVDKSGNLCVGTTNVDNAAGVGFKVLGSTSSPYVSSVFNTATSPNNFLFYNENATNNGYRFYVNVNGGIYNFSGNNSNLSDERTKENIELASSYLSKICAIPVKTFNYKDEPLGEQKTLGVIAQDVESVAPELVNNGGFGETKEGEQPLKSIYTTDMMYAMMKAIQELNAIVDAQAARIAALESK